MYTTDATTSNISASRIRFLDNFKKDGAVSWIKYADAILTQYRYRVEIQCNIDSKYDDCSEWCMKNCLSKYESHIGYNRFNGNKIIVYAFEKKADATAFKLACF